MHGEFSREQISWWRSSGRHAAVATSALCLFFALLHTRQEISGNGTAGPSVLTSAADAVDAVVKNAMDAVNQQRNSLRDDKGNGHGSKSARSDAVSFDSEHLPPDVAASMNLSVNPCDNFYEFTCGSWLKDTRIPKDRVRWSRSWDGAKEQVRHELTSLMTRDWPEESPFKKLGSWYSACMDMEAVEAEGAAPLQPMLQRIDAIETLADLHDYLVDAASYSLPTFMHMDVRLGQRKRGQKLLFIQTGAMILHKPDMYNASMPEFADHTAALHKYFVDLNLLAGSTPEEANFNADRTLELETIFAQWKKEDLWHHSWVNDPLGPPLGTLANLEDVSPSIPWRRIFTQVS